MKPVVLFCLLLLSILSACSGSDTTVNKTEKEQKKEVAAEQWKDLVGEYKVFVKELNPNKAESATIAMKKYQELFKDSDVQTCDTAFVVFHDFYEGLAGGLNDFVSTDKILQETEYMGYDENGRELPLPKAFKKLENQLSIHGYRLEFPEGMITIGYDRSFIAKYFYDFVSPEMKQFLTRLDHDNNEGFGEDAAIMIDEDEFVDRLIWWENFTKEHNDFILSERVKETKIQLFTFFLIGMDNTPCYYQFSEEDGVVAISEPNEYFLKMYEMLLKKYPKSESAKLVKPYFEALKKLDAKELERLKAKYTEQGYMMGF